MQKNFRYNLKGCANCMGESLAWNNQETRTDITQGAELMFESKWETAVGSHLSMLG